MEENVAKLRKSLQHWRTWDAEYEGLKEELSSGVNVQYEKDCTKNFILTIPEIFDLFGIGKGPIRHPIEVSRLVDRRLDYVQQNVSTISKQVEKTESQLSEVLEEMDRENDDTQEPGLPMTEIIEELDEDGNIISSKVTQPEHQTAQIIETLRKAGLKDMDSKSKNDDSTKDSASDTTKKPEAAPASKGQETSEASDDAPKATKKGVSFAEEVQEREIPSRADNANASRSSGVDPSLFNGSFANGERVIELDDDDDVIGAQAELEKQLRSRVIGNLGPNLESVDPVYDPEGLRRLVVRGEEGTSDENIKPAISKGKEAVKPDASAKKGVRFSEELDVQEAPKGSEAPVASKPRTAPIADLDPELQQRQLASEYYRLRNNIIRQQGGFKETEEEKDDPLMEQFPDGKLKKVSRFKAARMRF
ncbi:unnamed protein product, partial [Aureobasidium vineae]